MRKTALRTAVTSAFTLCAVYHALALLGWFLARFPKWLKAREA